jgi:hypothetical protein
VLVSSPVEVPIDLLAPFGIFSVRSSPLRRLLEGEHEGASGSGESPWGRHSDTTVHKGGRHERAALPSRNSVVEAAGINFRTEMHPDARGWTVTLHAHTPNDTPPRGRQIAAPRRATPAWAGN